MNGSDVADMAFGRKTPPDGFRSGTTAAGLSFLYTPGGYKYMEQNPSSRTKWGHLAKYNEILWLFLPDNKGYHGGGILNSIWYEDLNRALRQL